MAVGYLNVASKTKELNFKFSLKLNSHMWLVVTILDNRDLDHVENHHLV